MHDATPPGMDTIVAIATPAGHGGVMSCPLTVWRPLIVSGVSRPSGAYSGEVVISMLLLRVWLIASPPGDRPAG